MFHPMIDAKTGKLDVSLVETFWQPNFDAIVVVNFVKKVFYDTQLWTEDGNGRGNPEARTLFLQSNSKFVARVSKCVSLSKDRLYVNETNSSIEFSRPTEEHQRAWDSVQSGEDPRQWLRQ